MSDLSKEQQKELELIASEIEAEAIQMRLDYEATGSEESGSIIFVNENSPLLEDENEELGNTMIVGHFKNGLEEGEKEPVDYYILGPIELELDLYPMIVTYHSPFAQAVIGKEVGEHFTLDIEGKDTKFTVKSIEVVSPSKK